MTEQERLRWHLNGAIIAICSVFTFLAVACLALWHAGQWWEQAGWTLVETLVPAASFTLMGVVYLVRAKRQIFGSTSTSAESLEGKA